MERKREKLMAGELDTPPDSEEDKEAWIQEYAKLLDNIKATDPEKYQKLVRQLQEQVAQQKRGAAGKIKLPGQNRVLGEDGIEAGDDIDREEVIPQPGFVVKTRVNGQASNNKVFINVCTSNKLKKFKQVKKKMQDGTVQEGLNIPLSCGTQKVETDKQGARCVVYDIIVHPSVVTEALADKTGNFRHWVCNFTLQYIQQKHGVDVDYKYKLPKMKYKGDLSEGKTPTKQFIRKVGPSIEEVDTEEASGRTKTSKALKKKKESKRMQALEFAKYSVALQFSDARPDIVTTMDSAADEMTDQSFANVESDHDLPSKLVVKVGFPRLAVAERPGLKVEMSHELVVVTAPGYRRLELFLPLPARKEGATASFDGLAASELVLTLDVHKKRARDFYDDSDDGTKPDEGSRPWLLADALAGLAQESDVDKGGSRREDEEAKQKEMEEEEEEEFPEDAFHKQDVLSMHYIAEKKKQLARMKEKQKEAETEREKKIARAKAGDKSISLEGTDGGIITEVIGGDDEDDDDNDMPSLPAGFPGANGNDGAAADDDEDDEDEDEDSNFLKASTQFELLD